MNKSERPRGQQRLSKIVDEVYDELRRLASYIRRHERGDDGFDTSALVNELYVRLAKGEKCWSNRIEFMAVAARALRRVLVDQARKRLRAKRGGGAARVTLDSGVLFVRGYNPDLLDLDEALGELEKIDPRCTRLVELRFFAGYSLAAAAEALSVSLRTAQELWKRARVWLHSRLTAKESA